MLRHFGLRSVLALALAVGASACSSDAQERGDVGLLGTSSSPIVTNWCAGVPGYAPSYVAYPDPDNVVGPSDYGGTFTWVGEDFNAYSGGTPDTGGPCGSSVKVECSNDKGARTHLDVTKACLCSTSVSSQMIGQPINRVSSDDEKFRMVARAVESSTGKLRLFEDAGTEFKITLTGWANDDYSPNEQANQGISTFIRYRTEDDTYVASVKSDGSWFIKRIYCGAYTTVTSGTTSALSLTTYTVRLRAVNDTISGDSGVRLYFTLQVAGGSLVHLTPTAGFFDGSAPAALEEGGIAGVRTDFLTANLDDWIMY